ncbi:hypothetical protein GCM10022408_23250 [Hymenobacter fastidiosus]|uniref:DUF4293 family protein n=1 Tax=Hymenobacter fastidiosus TaxID=486264 RepID=A0ABP7SDP2_9BACT
MALPILVLGAVFNVLDAQNGHAVLNQLNKLSVPQGAGLLAFLVVGFLLFTRRFYARWSWLTCWLFVVVAVLVDYLVSGLCQHGLDASRNPEEVDLLNNVDFVVILPVILLALLLWGWAFDRVKNKAAKSG